MQFTPRIGFLLSLIYTIIIGFGMYWSYHVEGYVYGIPEMVKSLWWTEILLTILVIGASLKYASWKKVGFGDIKRTHLWWFLIPAIIIIISWFQLFPNIMAMDQEQFFLFALVAFTMALVGFSEELMYRGFALRALLTKYPIWLSMLLSAVLFSLLHSVNVLAGLLPEEAMVQLATTFLFGLFAAPLALKVNNLWPLVFLHWQWNFLLFSAELVGVESFYATGMILFQIAMIIPLWVTVLWRPKNNHILD